MKITLFLLLVFTLHCVSSARLIGSQRTGLRFTGDPDASEDDFTMIDPVDWQPRHQHGRGWPRRAFIPSSTTSAPEPEPVVGEMLSKEFLEQHGKFIETCFRMGCMVCNQNAALAATGQEHCRRVGGMRPGYMGGYLAARNTLTVKHHGFLEQQIEYRMAGEPNRIFKLRLIEVLELIKTGMVMKDEVVQCVPELVKYEEFMSFRPRAIPIFTADPEQELLNIEKSMPANKTGINLCFGQDRPDSKNCMKIDDKPACHAKADDLPTITLFRRADEIIARVERKEPESGENTESAFSLDRESLSQFRQGFNSVRSLINRAADPVTIDQVYQIGNSVIDFVSEHAFHDDRENEITP